MQTNKQTDKHRRPKHSTRRELRGRDRRADKRSERETLVIVLHPSLFERQTGVAA